MENLEHTCVYYENSLSSAEQRLQLLRKIDNYPEVKAYIIPVEDKFRVLRKIKISKLNNLKEPS